MTIAADLKDIAVIGLGVMGRNLALNLADHGFSVAASDPFAEVVTKAEASIGISVAVAATPEEAVALLAAPRKILMMVKAGAPVDALIDRLAPHLAAGDILIDGGNTHFRDTERRQTALTERGLHLVGLGVSGGEEGARNGPALMAGGDPAAIEAVSPALSAIAARASDGAPCFGTFGPGGAGHFVKMVHNGIEYAMMQTLAEAYLLMAGPGGLSAKEMATALSTWNAGPAASYLAEITATVFDAIDPETGQPLVERIRDAAAHKGTGRWTVEAGLQYGIAVPGIAAAFLARALSGRTGRRTRSTHPLGPASMVAGIADTIGLALPAAMLAAYAQGFALIAEASREEGWATDLAAVARSWRGGCIIRSAMLDPIAAALDAAPALADLTEAPFAEALLATSEVPLREVVTVAVATAVPTPAFSAAIAYLDGLRAPLVGANLIQAQRDLFGAHTFERIDRPGSFHHRWDG